MSPESFSPKAAAAAENIIGPPPTVTAEQLAAAEAGIKAAGAYEAPPQKPAEPLQDPNLNEHAQNLHITTIIAQPPK
ncbi:MAG: hypothetical protein JWO99_445 [Candidatus Saccharibacteria bacterium]|nr:hypothetical protein [Candidatus Saccharibacteria bacterium]